jgi:hypothetical protein
MKFTLQKSPGSNRSVSKLDVYDSNGTMCGRITVPIEEERDLLSHWQDEPTRSAAAFASVRGNPQRQNPLVSALQAGKRSPNAPAPPPRPADENPMIAALLREAPKNRLTRQAILRCC